MTRPLHPDAVRREQIVREHWPDLAVSAAKIAALIGGSYTKSAVIGLARRLELPKRPPANKYGSSASRRPPTSPKPTQPAAAPRPAIVQVPVLASTATRNPGTKRCNFPLWGDQRPREPGFGVFCGAPGYPWCARHRAIVWKTPEAAEEGERAA